MSKYESIKDFATIVDKTQEIKADKKGLGSFSSQSELKGAYKWIAPNHASEDKIVGYDSSQVIYDGTSHRFVVLFDKKSIEKGKANYLVSPIFKELSYKVEMKKLKKLPQELHYLLTDKLAYEVEGDYDKQVAKVLKKLRATKLATRESTHKLPVIGLDSPDQLAKVIDPLPISLYGAEKLAKIRDIASMVKALEAIEWVPASDNKALYSVASMFTQGWGTEQEMTQALYELVKTHNVPIELGYYGLSEEGLKELEEKANGIPVTQKHVPYIQWGEEGKQESIVLPFLKPLEALKGKIDFSQHSTSSALESAKASVKIRLHYENAKESVNQQVGGMASALGGSSSKKAKSVKLINEYFALNQVSNMPMDIWFMHGKNKKGDSVLWVYHNGSDGVEYDEVRIDPKIIPKKLEIELHNGNQKLDPLTFVLKEGQKMDEVFLTFAFASPELSEEGLKVIETKRQEAFDGVKEIAPFSKLQWANRAKIYKFVALQSKYEKHLQKTLNINAKRHKTPRAIMAMMERTPDNKLASSLDLRMVFNDVYGDENKTRSFNIMSGLYSAEAEAKAIPNGKGVFGYWDSYTDIQLAIVYDDNRQEIAEKLKKDQIKSAIIDRLQKSKKVWLFPLGQKENLGWLEVDPISYKTVSVFENGQYSATTENSILQQLTTGATGYGIGFFAGVKVSVTTLVSCGLGSEDSKSACKTAESIAKMIACSIGLAFNAANAKDIAIAGGNVGIRASACTGHTSSTAGGGRSGGIASHIFTRTTTSLLNGTHGGFAAAFADGVFSFFEIAKSVGTCP
jgi:hypothetical protein